MQKMREFVKQEYINENGEAEIHVRIPESYEFYHPLSFGAAQDLNPEIYDYIDSQSNLIPASIPLVIYFHSNKGFTETEQNQIKKMMTEHYEEQYYDLKWDKASQAVRITSLTILALVMLGLYIYMSTSAAHPLFEELLSMVATVAGREALEIILLDRRDTNEAMLNVRQNLDQRIVFVS